MTQGTAAIQLPKHSWLEREGPLIFTAIDSNNAVRKKSISRREFEPTKLESMTRVTLAAS
jgi:hypothetical protein